MSGNGGRPAAGGIVSSAGGRPISTAIACSSCARVTPTAIAWARVVSSWVRACATSAAETMPALYWFSVMRSDSAKAFAEVVEQPLQLVGDRAAACSCWPAGPGPRAGRWRHRRRWLGRWRRRPRRCGAPGPTDRAASSPIRCVRNWFEITPEPGARERARRRVDIGGREVAGAGLRDDRLGLAERRLGRFQVLVGDVDLPFEPVEHRVAEHRPPAAPVDRIGRARPLPARLLLVGDRHRRRRLLVIRPDRARRERDSSTIKPRALATEPLTPSLSPRRGEGEQLLRLEMASTTGRGIAAGSLSPLAGRGTG